MDQAGKAARDRKRAATAARLFLLSAFTVLLASGCGKEAGPEAGAESVRVTRYNCNIAEAHDVVDVYAEVVNRGSRATGPLDLVAHVRRPEEEPIEGRTSMGCLAPHEARQVSLRLACKGRVALRHISLAVEPTPAVLEEAEDNL